MAITSLFVAVFGVGAFAGGSVGWFARSVLADLKRDDEAVDRRIQAAKGTAG